MIHSLNLVKSIPNKEIRANITRWLYGIIPADGKTRSIETILTNPEKYTKITNDIENKKIKGKKIYI